MLSIGDHYAVICTEVIEVDDRKFVLENLRKGREIIEITLQQAENNFCANIIQVKSQNNHKEKFHIMSQAAFEGFTEDQKKVLALHGGFVTFPLKVIEIIGGGSARCMAAEVHLPRRQIK